MDLETGLYSDNPEFDQLASTIGNDLFHISSVNGQISELLRRQPNLSIEDSDKAIQKVQQNQLKFRHIKSEIESLQLFTDLTDTQKYSQSKLVVDFGHLFDEFKIIQKRVLELAQNQVKQPPPSSENEAADLSLSIDDNASNFGEQQALAFDDQLRQDEVSYQAGLAEEREEEIENIAQGMNELNEIYMNLGTLVTEQGRTIDNIESNIFQVNDYAQGGSRHLTSAAKWQRSNTGRSLCFLMILVVFALVIIIAAKF